MNKTSKNYYFVSVCFLVLLFEFLTIYVSFHSQNTLLNYS